MLTYASQRLSAAAALFKKDTLIAVAITMMVLVPLLMAPSTSQRWHGVKALGFEVGCVLLLCALIASARWKGNARPFANFLRKTPNIWLIVLIGWSTLSFAMSPDKQFAGPALMQLIGGALLFLILSHQVKSRSHYELFIDAFIAIAIVGSLAGFAMYGASTGDRGTGAFADHQLFGAFLMLLLPITLTAGFMPTKPSRRLLAQVAAVLCASCLLLARTRASWIGEAAALLTLGILAYRYVKSSTAKAFTTGARRSMIVSYVMSALAVLAAIITFICLSQMGGSLSERAASIGQAAGRSDESFQSRVQSWTGAIHMIAARPITGFGIGEYTLLQEPFTHLGRGYDVVKAAGPSLTEEAHDFYLQTAAETGVIGLILWLGFVVSVLMRIFKKVGALSNDSIRQRVLIACGSALIGQLVDAIANPSWQFGNLMLFFWVSAGLAMAATGIAEHRAPSSAPLTDSDAQLSPLGLRVQKGLRMAAAGACALALVPAIFDTSWVLPAEAYCGPPPCNYKCCGNSGFTQPCPSPCDFSCKAKTTCKVYSCGSTGGPWSGCTPISYSFSCGSGYLSCSWSGDCVTFSQPKKTCPSCTCTFYFSDGGSCSVPICIGS